MLLIDTNLGGAVLLDVERWDGPHDNLRPGNGQRDGVFLEDRPSRIARASSANRQT